MPRTSSDRFTSPADLVAIARAAHRVGDRALLASARRVLRSRFGIVLRFTEPDDEQERELQETGATS